MTWACEGKFRDILLRHPHPLGAGSRLPQAMQGRMALERRVSSAELTPIEHHLDDNGLSGTVTDQIP
jgi:hypothetical protein